LYDGLRTITTHVPLIVRID